MPTLRQLKQSQQAGALSGRTTRMPVEQNYMGSGLARMAIPREPVQQPDPTPKKVPAKDFLGGGGSSTGNTGEAVGSSGAGGTAPSGFGEPGSIGNAVGDSIAGQMAGRGAKGMATLGVMGSLANAPTSSIIGSLPAAFTNAAMSPIGIANSVLGALANLGIASNVASEQSEAFAPNSPQATNAQIAAYNANPLGIMGLSLKGIASLVKPSFNPFTQATLAHNESVSAAIDASNAEAALAGFFSGQGPSPATGSQSKGSLATGISYGSPSLASLVGEEVGPSLSPMTNAVMQTAMQTQMTPPTTPKAVQIGHNPYGLGPSGGEAGVAGHSGHSPGISGSPESPGLGGLGGETGATGKGEGHSPWGGTGSSAGTSGETGSDADFGGISADIGYGGYGGSDGSADGSVGSSGDAPGSSPGASGIGGPGGGDGGDGGTVLCTELYRQGIMPESIYRADEEFGKNLPGEVTQGYRVWAAPLAKLMSRSVVVTSILKPFVMAWAHHMAGNSNWFGAAAVKVGVPMCKAITYLRGRQRQLPNQTARQEAVS